MRRRGASKSSQPAMIASHFRVNNKWHKIFETCATGLLQMIWLGLGAGCDGDGAAK